MAVCGTCGVVESVTPVHQSAPPTGVGAVAGGVLGNQVGGGSRRAQATVARAVGRGYVGHQVERNVRTTGCAWPAGTPTGLDPTVQPHA